jgi:uncharacterized repeat protein (TIGR03803 family)
LHDFGSQPADGANPQSGVILDVNGNIYGDAALGATRAPNGTVFKLVAPINEGDAWTEEIAHRFRGSPDGKTPEGKLIRTKEGKLIGTTLLGGEKDQGCVYVAIPPSDPEGFWTVRILYSFGSFNGDGLNANQGLLASRRVFYGVTLNGGATGRGTVFELIPPTKFSDPWKEIVLYSFKDSGDAAFPSSELTMDAQENLYGTTTLGGDFNTGAVYKLAPPKRQGDSWTESVIYSFRGSDGSAPFGKLLLDPQNGLFGTTTSGGSATSAGTVFLLTPRSSGSWRLTTPYTFSGGSPDGGSPSAGVIMDQTGNLYGTAANGGNGGGGVVFKLTPNNGRWTESVLHAFSGPDGFRPLSTLVLRQGVLYGTTSAGGGFGTGTVFSLTP